MKSRVGVTFFSYDFLAYKNSRSSYQCGLTDTLTAASATKANFKLLLCSIASAGGNGSNIQWTEYNWAMSCDFIGNDMFNVQITRGECSIKCGDNSSCTHFTWNTYLGGTCWLKSGTISKSDAVPTKDSTMVCGIIIESLRIQWNGTNLAKSCDFHGNDMFNVRTNAEDCRDKCAQTPNCTNFTWNTYLGGTCWLKSGTVSKSDAVPARNPTMICGVVK